MPGPVEQQLLLHGSALRSLARDLVGCHDADDLLQDLAVQALRQPPARAGDLRGWLVRIVQRLAGRRRRAHVRRERHEGRAKVPDPEPGPDHVLEHRESLRLLTDALLALPLPYQRVLLLRYFEDATPTAIALRTGEPLATVKSRLQRGLAMLRERLDAGDQRDWRASIGALCGLRAAVPAGSVAIATGVLLMGTGAKFALGGLAAAIAVLAALWFSGPEGPSAASMAAPQQPQPGLLQAEAPAAVAATDPQQRREVAAPLVAPGIATAAIRGRCVDDEGRPMAGAQVLAKLQHRLSPTRVQQVGETNAVSGTDVVFALRLGSGGEYVDLAIDSEGTCPVSARFDVPPAGETRDLGDVVLPAAIRIRGRVIDEQGLPQQGVELSAWHSGIERRVVHPGGQASMTSRADGTFGPSEPLPPGHGWLNVQNRSLLRGSIIELALGREQPVIDVEVVVLSREPEGLSGIVVDESGQPLTEVSIGGADSSPGQRSDGTFTMAFLSHRGPGPFSLTASKQGYERAETAPLPRGTKDARIVLRRAQGVRIQVVAGDTLQPVPVFTVMLLGKAPTYGDVRTEREKAWPDGIALLTGVSAGDYAVWIAPDDERLSPSGFVPVKVATGLPAEVIVRLEPSRQRLLRVQAGAGRPVADVEVELIDPVGQPLRLETYAFVPSQRKWNGVLSQAQLLQAGRTDANGELMLRGPAQRELALRLRGGGLSLQLVRPVTFGDDAPLVVDAELQARWTGRLLPAEVAAELTALGSDPGGGDQWKLGLSLWRDGDALLRMFDPRMPVTADGTFAIDGIPSGTWQVTVRVGRSQWHGSEITDRAGQELRQDLDVTPLRPVRLDLQVLVDGSPFDGNVNVIGWHAMGRSGLRLGSGKLLHTEAGGHVRVVTFGGTIVCHVYARNERGERQLVVAPPFTVPAGGKVSHVLAISFARASLQITTPDGTPASGVELDLTLPDVEQGLWQVHHSDAEGRVLLAHTAAGRWLLRARPRSLGTEVGRAAFAARHGWEALRGEWVEVGPIELGPGAATQPIRVRLPPAWDR